MVVDYLISFSYSYRWARVTSKISVSTEEKWMDTSEKRLIFHEPVQ